MQDTQGTFFYEGRHMARGDECIRVRKVRKSSIARKSSRTSKARCAFDQLGLFRRPTCAKFQTRGPSNDWASERLGTILGTGKLDNKFVMCIIHFQVLLKTTEILILTCLKAKFSTFYI